MSKVDYCFTCWPGGPVTPPPCLRCGSRTDYYTSGLCRRCHRDGDPGVDSCPDCYAWGTVRTHRWLCRPCTSWRQSNTTMAPCAACRRNQHLSLVAGVLICRLCWLQTQPATQLQHDRLDDTRRDPLAVMHAGQQLALALPGRASTAPRQPVTAVPAAVRADARAGVGEDSEVLADGRAGTAVAGRGQLVLFTMQRDLAAHGRAGLHQRADPARAAPLEQRARDLGAERGWSGKQINQTCLGLRVVLGLNTDTDQPVPTSDVDALSGIDLPAWTVRLVLDEAGLLVHDRTPTVDGVFERHTRGLPEAMRQELAIWFEVMKNGSRTAPRRRPRSTVTIELHLRWAAPALHTWAAAGHTTLREITREHVLDVLPPSGNARSTMGQGLKSLFRLLKAHRVVFLDPSSRIKTGSHESRQPLPANLPALRAALHDPNPAHAAVVALIAFHALRAGQLQRLRLTDTRDGVLHVDGRVIPLAEPVRDRLRAWLDHRGHRWPATTNPHLFIHYRTAGGHDPVGHRWIRLAVGPGLTPAGIREDRILEETHATGGDVRQLVDLFGISVNATTRYAATLDHPDLIEAAGSRTHPSP